MLPTALDASMEFGVPIRVLPDGTVLQNVDAPYVTDLTHDDGDDYSDQLGPWSLMHGYTGQYGYNGLR